METKVIVTQNRFKSWAVWLSTSAFAFFVLKNILNLELDSATWDMVVNLALIMLTEFGILNSPTDKKSF